MGRLTAVPGGGPFNTARTIGRLGGEVAFLGCLSTDRFGARAARRPGRRRRRPVDDRDDRRADDAGRRRARRRTAAPTYRFHTSRHVRAAPVGRGGATTPSRRRPRSVPRRHARSRARADGRRARRRRSPAVRRGTLVMLDPNCRPGVITRPRGLPRPARARSSPAPTSSRSASTTSPTSRRPPRRSPPPADLLDRGPALVLVTDGRASGHRRHAATGVARDPGPGGRRRRYGRRRATRSVARFLARWIERGLGRAALGRSRSRRATRSRLAVEVAAVTCSRAGADPPRRAELGWPPRRPAGR